LGRKAFHHFRKNVQDCFQGVDAGQWESYEQTFTLACLLHDCAHAPFSHTFEEKYDFINSGEPSRLKPLLLAEADDDVFSSHFNGAANKPSPHEMASAIVVLREFRGAIRDLGGDPLLACRMILGCRHLGANSDVQHIENCLISLLNGQAIDVDKLDYILRDTWASGVNNVSIDTHRLLASLTYDEKQHRLGFQKSALSVLQSVVDARNYLYKWIFGHHKVVYNKYLLESAIDGLARILSSGRKKTSPAKGNGSSGKKLSSNRKDKILSKLFSLESFSRDVKLCDGVSVFLPTDQDLTVLMKKHRAKIPAAVEYLSRQHRRRALWKTAAEFETLFPNKKDDELVYIETHAKEQLDAMLNGSAANVGFVVQKIPQKFVLIRTGEIMVQIEGVFYSYDDDRIFGKPSVKEKRNAAAFYVYAPLECMSRRQEFIQKLQSLFS
jgi:hypothetical protein